MSSSDFIAQASNRNASYKLEYGTFGPGECYRLTIDYHVLIAFDEASFYGGMVGLRRDGEQKATLGKEHRIPHAILKHLKEIAEKGAGDD